MTNQSQLIELAATILNSATIMLFDPDENKFKNAMPVFIDAVRAFNELKPDDNVLESSNSIRHTHYGLAQSIADTVMSCIDILHGTAGSMEDRMNNARSALLSLSPQVQDFKSKK